jgi:hypothetical protein
MALPTSRFSRHLGKVRGSRSAGPTHFLPQRTPGSLLRTLKRIPRGHFHPKVRQDISVLWLCIPTVLYEYMAYVSCMVSVHF